MPARVTTMCSGQSLIRIKTNGNGRIPLNILTVVTGVAILRQPAANNVLVKAFVGDDGKIHGVDSLGHHLLFE